MLVKRAFERLNVEAYLDVLDDTINAGGKALTDHIKNQLNSCTDIIVVMSENTKYSWWVPFEIGMSAEIDMPTASYLISSVSLPDYLEYWPRLKNTSDIATYVSIRRQVTEYYKRNYPYSYSQSSYRSIETPVFYDQLKRELR